MPTAVDFWTLFLIAALVLTPVIALYAVWRSRRTTRETKGPGTAWATVALVVVRVVIAVTLLGYAAVTVSPGHTSTGYGDRVELEDGWYDEHGTNHKGQRLLVSMLTTQRALQLCPYRMAPVPGRPGVTTSVERNCWARRNLDQEVDGVDVGAWTMTKEVVDPPASVGRTLMAFSLLGLFGFAVVALSLERILRLTTRRQPFAAANVHWLRLLAGGVALVGIVSPVLVDRYADTLVLEHMGQAGEEALGSEGFAVGATPFFVVVLILVLAEIWQFGIRLQAEAEATV